MKKYYYLIIVIVVALIIYSCLLIFSYNDAPRRVYTVLSSKDFACKEIAKQGCEISTYQIILNKCPDQMCYDANKDGKIDEHDTFQALCETYFGTEIGNQTACKELCGCP